MRRDGRLVILQEEEPDGNRKIYYSPRTERAEALRELAAAQVAGVGVRFERSDLGGGEHGGIGVGGSQQRGSGYDLADADSSAWDGGEFVPGNDRR